MRSGTSAWIGLFSLVLTAACGSRTDVGGSLKDADGTLSSSSSGTVSSSSGGGAGSGGAGATGGTGGTGGVGGTGGSGAGGYCGNALIDPGEQCDDGNGNSNDACLYNCVAAYCGDGVQWFGVEACDDGNLNNSDNCLTNCAWAACGDGFVWAGFEACDDGNNQSGDGCSSNCMLEICGDGFVDAGEECDLGGLNEDRPAIVLSQGAFVQQGVWPIDRPVDASGFYSYSSASSHTGYEAVMESRLFLYRDTSSGELSLFMHHGIDLNASGQQQPQGKAAFDIQGLPAQVYVSVADDQPNEFSKNSATSALGKWSFNNNSDGGVLSGLPFPGNWSIVILAKFDPAINAWSFVNGDEFLYGLGMNEPLLLTAYDSPAPCRLNCTIPVCGDGILDGGEVCDDGNMVNGDGCSANCLAVFP